MSLAQVYHLRVGDSLFTQLSVDDSTITENQYAVNASIQDATYFWRVRSRYNEGNWSDWSEVWNFSIRTVPSAPSLLSPLNGSTGILTNPALSWNSVSGASSYGLQVSTDSIFSGLVFDQSGITAVSQQISGLSEGTLYFWRVNATRLGGTTDWSDPWYFTTSYTYETGTITGNDGKIYQTVKIGNQWWMAENLKETQYRNGDTIPIITDNSTWTSLSIGARCAYDNSESNAAVYGYLYNWYTVNDTRNMAHPGWHVPTDDEWITLEKYLGMSQSAAEDIGWRGTIEGGKLKETGTTHWSIPNESATNESGFSAIPAGYRAFAGRFYNIGSMAYFWTATETAVDNALYRALSHFYSGVYSEVTDYSGGDFGLSIRCVKD